MARTPPPLRVRITPDAARRVRGGHPWVFGTPASRERIAPGTDVALIDGRDRFVARALADDGPIGARVFSLRNESIGRAMFESRVESAAELRRWVMATETNAYRLVHGEGDRLPGFVCDIYAACAVVKTDGAAATSRRSEFFDALRPALEVLGVRTLLFRHSRSNSSRVEVVSGPPPSADLEVVENGMPMRVDVLHGQKTGLFLDQRNARARVRTTSHNAAVLNLFGYTGGFSLAAALGGARHVTTVDIAPRAIEAAQANLIYAGIARERHAAVTSDVYDFLAKARSERRTWDLVIADPPSFAPNEASVEQARSAYRSLHYSCITRVRPGGLYLAGSCSSHVALRDFLDTLARGATDAERVLQVLEVSGAPADHPRLAAFPEGDYLKVVLCRAL